MSDKDQFTFDDNDDFPEADLSSAFSDGEFEADTPAPDVQGEPEPMQEQNSKKIKKVESPSGSGGSRSRVLLIVLLLVVAGAAGAYYFMDLGGTTPVAPTVPASAQKAQKTVALPPQPAKAPASAPAKTEPDAKPVAVAVPPPPPPAQPAAEPVASMAAPAQKPIQTDQPVVQAKAADKINPALQTAEVEVAPASKPLPTPELAAVPAQVAGGTFSLDAGSYLFESNRDALVTKLEKLGYESLVTPVEAKLDMTRLRLGTYRKEEVQKALDFARSIEPGAYSAPAGNGYVIYVGTFLRKNTVDRLTKRFLAEGIKVHPEPVQVVRTLSRIRFGSFATRADAVAAADAAVKVGVNAVVVKVK